jgi:hypothetical protein
MLQKCMSTRYNADVHCKLQQSLPKVELPATIAATCLSKMFGLHGRLDGEIFHATCVAMPMSFPRADWFRIFLFFAIYSPRDEYSSAISKFTVSEVRPGLSLDVEFHMFRM